jgi:hypothetical protein
MLPSKPDRLQDFTTASVVFAALLASLAIIPFYIDGDLARGRLASYSAFCIFLIAYATWKMRDKVWYFPTASGILIIHLFAIFAVPLQALNGLLIALFPLAAVDVFGLIYVLNRLDQR